MNNIFEYSPKELTTDAFLKWIFCELNKDQYTDSVAQFFFQLGLCENRNSSIRTIHVSLQEQKTDLILRYVENGEEQKVLFENKTRTTIHSEQLQRYKEIFPNCDYYKYLKLAYIFHSERKIASQNGYDVIDVHMIYAALKGLKSNHYLVCQYMEFLSIKFIEPMNRITKDLIRNNEYSLFKDGQAQQYFLSHLVCGVRPIRFI